MAKSRDTFNKQEVQKKKDKKKKEKEEKKEARKANTPKQSFEDMLAYVDENGNISSTPPDPSKNKSIELENIQISVAKQSNTDPIDSLRNGTVTFFNESKGYGFIKDLKTQESIFVHLKGLTEPIKERDKVSFEVEKTPKGLSAIGVKIVK